MGERVVAAFELLRAEEHDHVAQVVGQPGVVGVEVGDEIEHGTFKLVANLPYAVATPIISNLLGAETVPASMTVTIQKELADRIVAVPRTKDYGSLSIWVQSQCYAAIVRELAPSVFWPRPKVNSAIVQIVLDHHRRQQIGDLAGFHDFTRGIFLHRRKFLRSSLISSQKQLTKSDVDALMEELELGPESRAEELSIDQMLNLYRAVASRSRSETN